MIEKNLNICLLCPVRLKWSFLIQKPHPDTTTDTNVANDIMDQSNFSSNFWKILWKLKTNNWIKIDLNKMKINKAKSTN